MHLTLLEVERNLVHVFDGTIVQMTHYPCRAPEIIPSFSGQLRHRKLVSTAMKIRYLSKHELSIVISFEKIEYKRTFVVNLLSVS